MNHANSSFSVSHLMPTGGTTFVRRKVAAVNQALRSDQPVETRAADIVALLLQPDGLLERIVIRSRAATALAPVLEASAPQSATELAQVLQALSNADGAADLKDVLAQLLLCVFSRRRNDQGMVTA